MTHVSGFLVLDKPAGITSRDAVNRVQRWFPGGTRVGHAGTLDPLATGVLVIAVGRATRLIEYVQEMEKEYHAVFVLGATSVTDDAQGPITPVLGASVPTREEIEGALSTLVGVIEQVPPRFSAMKVEGRRAHKLARCGQTVDLTPRRVVIHEIKLLRYEHPAVEVQVRCGKGTYIRALARDLGQMLGCGGYVRTLRRTRVGRFVCAESAARMLDLPECPPLLPLQVGLPEQTLALEDDALARLEVGQSVPVAPDRIPSVPSDLAVFDRAGHFHLIGAWDEQKAVLRPIKVFKDAE